MTRTALAATAGAGEGVAIQWRNVVQPMRMSDRVCRLIRREPRSKMVTQGKQ